MSDKILHGPRWCHSCKDWFTRDHRHFNSHWCGVCGDYTDHVTAFHIEHVNPDPRVDWNWYGKETPKPTKSPVATGCLDYFPDALLAVAEVSAGGNKQHGTQGWDRSKAPDEDNAAIRHFLKRGTLDHDGLRHSAKFAWRALALLQKEIEAERKKNLGWGDAAETT